jgi:transcriptional regulator with GAF, ATPase, and Fis domain/Tfp pilus assembly protein PilF
MEGGSMTTGLPEFSTSQWEFLAVLHLFRQPTRIDLIGELVPLPPGPFLELLNESERLGWLQRRDEDAVELVRDLPDAVIRTLEEVSSKEKVSEWVNHLESEGLLADLPHAAAVTLLLRTERAGDAARLETKAAREALDGKDLQAAFAHLEQSAELLASLSDKGRLEGESLLACADLVMELSDVCFSEGSSVKDLPALLETFRDLAERQGDLRSWALIGLHMGRLLYFSDKRGLAFDCFSEAEEAVVEMGDEDILWQSARFLGVFSFMQGNFRRAIEHFERALRPFGEARAHLISPYAPLFMAVSCACLGEFHRAIGILDYHSRGAEQEGRFGLAAVFRAQLGIVLLQVNNRKEGLTNLEAALSAASEHHHALALYLAQAGKAYYHFLAGALTESWDNFKQALEEAEKSGIVRQYGSGFVLEMLYEFKRLGFPSLPGFDFDSEVEKILAGHNKHLRGVALRLVAVESRSKGGEPSQRRSYLHDSAEFLRESGDPVQSAKTLFEMARLDISQGDKDKARHYVEQARQGLEGYAEEFFQDDLKYLFEILTPASSRPQHESTEQIFQRFLDVMEQLVPSPDLDETLSRCVAALNRFLGAERGGLFWFRDSREPVLRVGVNLTNPEVHSEGFRDNLNLVMQAYDKREPVLARPGRKGKGTAGHRTLAVLCLPFETEGRASAVLYHDNSYLNDSFDFLDTPLLLRLVRHLSLFIDRIWQYGQLLGQQTSETSPRVFAADSFEEDEMVAQSPLMEALLTQADQVARSESIVLILGETGVGKELLARRIHRMSDRRSGPYVVIDATTIPENLIESELFGHEKGAFTGADRQKPGRIELANRGTLFLDEVGDLPLAVQGKLLRFLEERAFLRIGGRRSLTADCRLLAATNRNLDQEVAAGRFRRDLFYRLNVVPLTIPPLRERKEDILPLVGRFLDHYGRDLHGARLGIPSADEKRLTGYPWPGNVRELKNMVERAVLLFDGRRLDFSLPVNSRVSSTHPFADMPTMDELQRRYIRHVLQRTGGRIRGPQGAAEQLGMKRTTLYARMKKLGLT